MDTAGDKNGWQLRSQQELDRLWTGRNGFPDRLMPFHPAWSERGVCVGDLRSLKDRLEEEGWAWSSGEVSQLPKASMSNYKAERKRACHRVTCNVRGWNGHWRVPLPCHLQGKDLELGWLPRAGTDVAPLHSTRKLNQQGLPWWPNRKESTCQCGRHGFDPRSRKIPHAVE